MKPLFELLDEVTQAADRDAGMFGPISPGEELFDFAIFNRGTNILKAVSVLTENGHWEMAAASNRQLFELILNTEEVNRHDDRSTAIEKYRGFGALQVALGRREELRYNEETGRPVDTDEVTTLDTILESEALNVFKAKPYADGRVRWVDHWNRKNAKAMAEASDDDLRAIQYRQLFSRWSEEAHSSPGALFAAMNRTADEGWIAKLMADDDVHTAEIVSIAITLFLELRELLPNAPALDPAESMAWIERLRTWTIDHFDIDNTYLARRTSQ